MTRLRVCALAALASFASSVDAPLLAQAPVIDLGTLGGPYAFATALNNHQQVVGQSVDAAETRLTAFLWEDGAMRDLSTAALHFDIANDINDRGQIVGAGIASDGRFVAARWEDEVLAELPMPAGASSCSAEAINDHGDIVGFCDQQPGQWATLWRRNGDVQGLGPTPDGWSAGPVDINERGVVFGAAIDADGARHLWVWDDGVVTEVGNVPGGPVWLPTAFNNREQIVGWGGTPLATFAALLDDGVVTALPQAAGHTRSAAESINERGEIVGWHSIGGGPIAVIWANGQVRVLPSLPGAASSIARDINDRGVAIGTFAPSPGGGTRALLWPKASTRIPPGRVDR